MGHSGARESIVRDIIGQGGKFVYIHLGNGLNKINLRQGQSRLFESVAEMVDMAECTGGDLYAELILDGVHLDRRFILWANYMFGKERVVGITDNICVTGTPPTKEFVIAGTPAIVSDENPNAIWVEGHVGEILCGSKATLEQILQVYVSVLMDAGEDGAGLLPYFLKERHRPKDFEEAMDWALHALATNPARLYGIGDTIGGIAEGMEASLVALDASDPSALRVRQTWVRGQPIKEASLASAG
jgi:N-acetylglucosamine-6-phosphate deacetylase